MPTYDSAGATPTAGHSVLVWNAEVVPAAAAASPPEEAGSQQVGLHRDSFLPSCLSVEVRFDSAPGTFDIELQVADTDEDIYYVKKQSLTAVDAVNFVGRMEVTGIVARYARLYMRTLTNAVAVTAKIT